MEGSHWWCRSRCDRWMWFIADGLPDKDVWQNPCLQVGIVVSTRSRMHGTSERSGMCQSSSHSENADGLCQAQKQKLCVVFINFSKAYDRVLWHLLVKCLITHDCSPTLVQAITAIYHNTKMISDFINWSEAGLSNIMATVYPNREQFDLKPEVELLARWLPWMYLCSWTTVWCHDVRKDQSISLTEMCHL